MCGGPHCPCCVWGNVWFEGPWRWLVTVCRGCWQHTTSTCRPGRDNASVAATANPDGYAQRRCEECALGASCHTRIRARRRFGAHAPGGAPNWLREGVLPTCMRWWLGVSGPTVHSMFFCRAHAIEFLVFSEPGNAGLCM